MSGNDFLLSRIGGSTGALEEARIQKLHQKTKEAENVMKMAEGKDGGKAGGPSPAERVQMDKAASQFEGLLLHQMFNTMWKTVPQDGMLSGGREEQIYRDMLNQTLADQVSQGKGVGLKDVIFRELMRKYGG